MKRIKCGLPVAEEILKLRLELWGNRLKALKRGAKETYYAETACLVASICDTKDDLKTIQRTKKILSNFETIMNKKVS